MTDTTTPAPRASSAACDGDGAGSGQQAGKRSKSMHDGVPVWYDCCSCEAEPYWLESGADDRPPGER